MEELNIDDYKNLLDEISLTSGEIENNLKDYKLVFFPYKNPIVERGMKIPLFLKSFYAFIKKYKRIPTQNEMFDGYISMNQDYFNRNNFNEDIMHGIKARAFRAYPSLVRDIHFNLYVKENLKEANVIFNPKLDYINGIDILIDYNDIYYGVNLYTDTIEARKYRKLKDDRKKSFSNELKEKIGI